LTFNGLRAVISQKTELVIGSAVTACEILPAMEETAFQRDKLRIEELR
jgi:hypothetical protein